jgi:hypothetical protein
MRLLLAPLLLGVPLTLLVSSRLSGSQPEPDDRPYVVECYYRARWGYADEFIRLFKKNHLPVLNKLASEGRITKITAVKPRYHGTEDGRWDYRVTLVFKNAGAAFDSAHEDEIKKQLFPGQETYEREEQRRFEILSAHWDVPVVDVPLGE